ncbi:MAG: hypothetical protein H5U19_13995 [Rhodobacteraceae bacterium]|nr:hypothetical protein [Paracoccaceae bacterium]
MWRVVLCLLLICLIAPQGHAGPWPREKGQTFVSVWAGAERVAGRSGRLAGSYSEYGVTDRVTVSTAVESRAAASEVMRWEVGARWYLGDVGAGAPISVGLGVQRGTVLAGPKPATRARVVVHYGRGFDRPLQGGWLRSSASVLPSFGGEGTDFETYSQAGLRPTATSLVMLSIGTYHTDRDDFLKISPALGHEIGRLGTLVVEATQEIGNDRDRRLTVALWRRF